MADKRISDLNLHTSLELSDSLPIINNGETKKTTYGSLYYGIREGLATTGSNYFIGNQDISGSIYDVNSVTFNSSSIPPILPQYTLAANTTDKTLDLRMGNNATLQVGQEMYYPPIVNKSGVDLNDGDLVMINPAGIAQGNRISVVKAIGNGTYPADFMVGILTENIAHNAEGFATWFGYVRNISKTHLIPADETWLEGDVLYPHPTTAGKMTKVLPTAPALKSTIAVVTSINGTNVTILVRPQLRGKISTLHDVDTITAVTGSMFYNSGLVWKNTENVKIQNGYTILSQVSSSYNYANDTEASVAGVPLGGLYHTSGSVKIRLV
jgi:hypothetical protein